MDRPAHAELLSDAALIGRVLDGQVAAFARLVSRYQGPLYRYAAAMVLDHETAADLVQDAFVRAYTHLSQVRDPNAFRTWIFRTLRHLCLDHMKQARRRDVRLGNDDHHASRDERPDDRLVRQELRRELRIALLRLPDAQREAFTLHCVEGLGYEEMSELLDASVSALKMRVLRAREALGGALRGSDVTDLGLDRLYGHSRSG